MGTPELWHCIRAVARAATLSIRQTVPVSRRGLASIAATGESGSSPAISTSPTGLPRLSSGQAALLSRLRRGESVYFTGKAGAGKTEVLRRFIDECKNDPARRYATEVTVRPFLLSFFSFHKLTHSVLENRLQRVLPPPM
ncbi:hypothetical protein BCR33DRAFT_404578 [Rhizoclosmatium globosum]|uniref:Orc1-like AAA ATPase domain-containing protein n=1 Tax=Rhizoclosmatium globosum TaxID=329046 RepID=A0A1Y2CY83_9FUNG|nr:hypothetical protein BCR33DRAFT_404578 [Rhizoclosmatium globosum]|eukprot:ORY51983.1 hypothetical protein BCR33DRAFT_404578 [Rhizoclosmatium globosum]